MPKRNIDMYPVEEEILNRALESPSGVKVQMKDPEGDYTKWSIKTRHRLNQCREADRQRNARTYPEDSPLHGKSPFDGLMISLDTPNRAIKIFPRMESLDDIEISEL